MTRCIFVPWDGSECAARALAHAIGLAQAQDGCGIHVAHAHEEPDLYGEIAVYVSREKMERLQREHSEALLAEAAHRLQAARVPYRTEVLVGPVGKALAERAAALGCDAIVMGTHGRGALAGLVMGSVATKVVRFSALPVTLVK